MSNVTTTNPAMLQAAFVPTTPVLWGPFETTILALQRSGWQLRIEKVDYGNSIRLYGNNEGHAQFVSDRVDVESIRLSHSLDMPNYKHLRALVLNIRMAESVNIVMHTEQTAIFTEPAVIAKLMSYDGDLYHWHVFDRYEKEIVVAEPSILDLLNQIKERQLPKAKELIRREIKNSVEIITLGEQLAA